MRSAESAPRRRGVPGRGSRPALRGAGTGRFFVVQQDLRLSIGEGSAVPGTRGPACENQVLEVREGLGEGKTAPARIQVLAEERDRDLVGVPRPGAKRCGGLVEPAAMVFDDLPRPSRGVLDGIAVAGKG